MPTEFISTDVSNDAEVDFSSPDETIRAFQSVIDGPATPAGYIVLNHLFSREDIAAQLNIDASVAFVIAKNKIRTIARVHGLSPWEMREAIAIAMTDPVAIALDSLRKSFQFSVLVGEKKYRTVLAFRVMLRWRPDTTAHIVVSIFREDRLMRRMDIVKKGGIQGVALIYEKGEGWAALATSSPTNVSYAVAAATREDLFSSDIIVGDLPEEVK